MGQINIQTDAVSFIKSGATNEDAGMTTKKQPSMRSKKSDNSKKSSNTNKSLLG